MPLVKVVYEDTWQKFFDLPFLPREGDCLCIGRMPEGDRLDVEVQFLTFFLQSQIVAVFTEFYGDREKDEEFALADENYFITRGWENFAEEELR